MSVEKRLPALHEILAVEADAQGVVKRVVPETIHAFKEKPTHFQATERTLQLTKTSGDEAATAKAEAAEATKTTMVTTVNEKLAYTLESVSRFWDIAFQKEATNQRAVADIVIDDVTIATKVPAQFLLGLEKKLVELRTVYEAIPTLAPGIEWEADPSQGPNVFKRKAPVIRAKTAKEWMSKTLSPATEKHPAQIEKWEETVNVGYFTDNVWSSLVTPAQKSELLGRIDQLIQSVKQARQRANSTEVDTRKIASSLVNFIHPQGL